MADDIQFVNNNVIVLFPKKNYSNQLMINIVSFLLNHNVQLGKIVTLGLIKRLAQGYKGIGKCTWSFAIILK